MGSAVVLAAPATEPCASTCAHSNCEGLNIHYGTYCGVGHTGCPGVKPCDDFDACCEAHDNCVTVNSIVSTGCHSTLSSCLHKALERGSRTWIQEKQEGLPAEAAMCTPTQLVKTMTSGMQLASMFSLFMGAGAARSGAAEGGAPQQGGAVQGGNHTARRPSWSGGGAEAFSSSHSTFEQMRARHEEIRARHGKNRQQSDSWARRRRQLSAISRAHGGAHGGASRGVGWEGRAGRAGREGEGEVASRELRERGEGPVGGSLVLEHGRDVKATPPREEQIELRHA